MIGRNLKISWLSKLALWLTGVKCLFSIWCADKEAFFSLLKTLKSSSDSFDRLRMFFEKVVMPAYRLKATIKIGRPSVAVYRKFPEVVDFLQLSGAEVISSSSSPSYLLVRNGAMGDVLMLTPVIRALYLLHKGDIYIDVATDAQMVFENNPYVRKVILPKHLSRGVKTYDVVVDLNGVYERMPNVHPVNAYAKLILGAEKTLDKKLDLYPAAADVSFIDEVVNRIGAPFLVVHQFVHDWPNRTIPDVIWQEAVEAAIASRQLKVIFVGTTKDLAPVINAQYEDHRALYTIQQLSLLISRSQGFIGGDSGPSHIAATTSAPMAVFYTCAHHESRMPLRTSGRFLPIFPNIDCYGCLTASRVPRPGYFCQRGDNACVNAVGGGMRKSVTEFFAESTS